MPAAPRHAWPRPIAGAAAGGAERCRHCGAERLRTPARRGIYGTAAKTRYRQHPDDDWAAVRPPCHDPEAPLQFDLFTARPDDLLDESSFVALRGSLQQVYSHAAAHLPPTSDRSADSDAHTAHATKPFGDRSRISAADRDPVTLQDLSGRAQQARDVGPDRGLIGRGASTENGRPGSGRTPHLGHAPGAGGEPRRPREPPYAGPPPLGPLPDGVAWEVFFDIEPEVDVAIVITVRGQSDPIAGSRRLRKVSTIESTCRLLMGSMGKPRGARCDAWDRTRRLSWAWMCDGATWKATADVRPPPWAEADRQRAERKRLWMI